jgi:uncharacterized protein (DUF427 family)
MAKASWNGQTIAEANGEDVQIVEGNIYFPPSKVKKEMLRESALHTTCPWKGIASYYDVVIGETVNKDAAWYYPEPKTAAANITGFVAFWKGVKVEP